MLYSVFPRWGDLALKERITVKVAPTKTGYSFVKSLCKQERVPFDTCFKKGWGPIEKNRK